MRQKIGQQLRQKYVCISLGKYWQLGQDTNSHLIPYSCIWVQSMSHAYERKE